MTKPSCPSASSPVLPNRRTILVASAIAAPALILRSAPAFAAAPIIGMSIPNASTIGALVTEQQAAKKKGEEMGYNVVLDDPGTDLNKQINTVKTWIQQRIAVIVCSTLQPAAFESIAEEARKAGVKWINSGIRIKNEDAFVGFAQYHDGRALGEYAGEWVTKTLGGNAKAAILGYEPGVWGQQRASGIKEGLLAKAPGVSIVAQQDAISPVQGLNVTRSILQAHPDINVILPVEDPATEGAYKAWIAAGKDKADPHGFIGGMDGTIPALKLLREGGTVYRASMAIPLRSTGEKFILTADALLHGRDPGDGVVPLELVMEKSPRATEYLEQQGEK